MSFTERTGNLFEATGLDAIAHGVNCQGVMGAGIALQVAKLWPDVVPPYRQMCLEHRFFPGDVFDYVANDGQDTVIYNLATQNRIGPDAKLRYVAWTLAAMLEMAEGDGIKTIGMPRIGCGIGGLEWVEVRMIVELLASESAIEVVVFSL